MVIGLSVNISGLLKVKRRICGTVAQHVKLCTIITSADVQKETATILPRLSSLKPATIGVLSSFPARKKGVPAQEENECDNQSSDEPTNVAGAYCICSPVRSLL